MYITSNLLNPQYQKMAKQIITQKAYNDEFNIDKNKKSTDYNLLRLEKILDIRKFEIELYWKRAGYFWAFIAIIATGYGSILINFEAELRTKFEFLMICIGIVFSLAWFLVNKGSKYWQENWEKHLDLNEDEIIGPLYKTTINKDKKATLWSPTSHYPISVSRVNQILSLFVLLIWIGLLFDFVFKEFLRFQDYNCYCYTLFCYLFIVGVSSCMICRMLKSKTGNEDTFVDFSQREIKP